MFSPDGVPKAEKFSPRNLRKSEILADWNKRADIIARNKTVKYGPLLISAEPQDAWEISISLTRKVKGSVQRNHIKRILREAYRQSKPFLFQPHVIIFTVTSNFEFLDFHRLQSLLIQNFGSKDESD